MHSIEKDGVARRRISLKFRPCITNVLFDFASISRAAVSEAASAALKFTNKLTVGACDG